MASQDQHHEDALFNLAKTVQYNLEHEKDWTGIKFHSEGDFPPLRGHRPLLYGLPPRRMYVHPDEQIEILKAEKDLDGGGRIPQPPELEWVLPIHLAEKWTLGRFAAVFDSIGAVPPGGEPAVLDKLAEGLGGQNAQWMQWRGPKRGKRLILAIVQDDSTVSYYLMHDGIVKPRQN